MNTITISNGVYACKFGRKALAKVLSLAGAKSINESEKIASIPIDKWGDFVHAGLETGAKINGTEPPTLAFVNDALDDDMGIYTSACEIFTRDLTPSDKPVTGEGN